MSFSPSPFSLRLAPYQLKIEEAILSHIAELKDEHPLKQAYAYALTSGGKRFRPSLVMMTAAAIGKGIDVSSAALAIELFHTASLIADDLPCMDNDAERRHMHSLHKVFGDATALLVSYGLIAAGYGLLAKNGECLVCAADPSIQMDSGMRLLRALQHTAEQTGVNGATGGQFFDLFPPDQTLSTLREIITKKTVSLFEISFVLGWIFGGGELEKLPLLKEASAHFGMAFQIADDLGDMAQDQERNNILNMGLLIGKEAAEQLFKEEVSAFRRSLQDLRLMNADFEALLAWLVDFL